MFINLKKYIFLSFLLFFVFPVCAETVTSEVLNLKSENNLTLIEVAKKYPKIKISQFQSPNKILIELLETSFHKTFSFDKEAEINFLKGLNFVSSVTVGEAKYVEADGEKQKISIVLDLKDKIVLKPKLQSTKNNIVTISFLPSDINIASNEMAQPPKQEGEDLNQLANTQIQQLYNNAVDEQTNGNPNAAEKLYKEVLSKDKNFYLAAFNLTRIYVDKKNFEAAINILKDLIDKTKKSNILDEGKVDNLTYIFNMLSNVYYLKGDLAEAENVLNELLKINPSSHQAYFSLGLIDEKKRDLDKAKSNFEKTIELKSDFSEAYYHLGVLELINKHKKNAISNFNKVIELKPDSTVAKLSKKELEKISGK